MNVSVLGANRQLGSDVCAAFLRNGDEVGGPTYSDLELGSGFSVSENNISHRRTWFLARFRAISEQARVFGSVYNGAAWTDTTA
jgi:hypothetical protein